MIRLHSENIVLRALEPEDLSYFLTVENDSSLWSVCDTRVPFSKFALEKIMEVSTPDIFADKQLRLVICERENGNRVGFVDFYDFSPLHRRTGIGVIIYPADKRGKGYAKEAVRLAVDYAFEAFNLYQVWAEVRDDNNYSRALFESLGFERTGVKPHWQLLGGQYIDVYTYHLIKEKQK